MIFAPLGAIELADEAIRDAVEGATDSLSVIETIAAAIGHSGAGLLGDVLYTGFVAGAVLADRERRAASLRAIARGLPYRPLILADLLYAAVVVAGLLLLVVPGVLALAWFALVPAAIEVERLGVRAAFERSRALVRGSALRVLAVIVPALAIESGLGSAIEHGVAELSGGDLGGQWLGGVAANLVTAPFYALAIVLAFYELRRLRDPEPAPAKLRR